MHKPISQLIFYVYAYLREDGTPYYIGKGSGKRAWKHVKSDTIHPPIDKSRIILLERNLTELGSFAIERRMIEWYGRKDIGTGILRNMSDGGDGCSGYKHTAAARAAISDYNAVAWKDPKFIENYRNAMKDVWSNPIKNAAISKANSGKGNPMYGKSPPNKLNLTPDERSAHNKKLNAASYLRRKARKEQQ
jgi:hypothetical protein